MNIDDANLPGIDIRGTHGLHQFFLPLEPRRIAGVIVGPHNRKPVANADAFVLKAIERVKKVDAKRALDKVVEESGPMTRGLLISDNSSSSLGEKYPTLCPLTWLCNRLRDSNGAAGWGNEFQTKTGLSASMQLDAKAVAVQVFRERISQRQYAAVSED